MFASNQLRIVCHSFALIEPTQPNLTNVFWKDMFHTKAHFTQWLKGIFCNDKSCLVIEPFANTIDGSKSCNKYILQLPLMIGMLIIIKMMWFAWLSLACYLHETSHSAYFHLVYHQLLCVALFIFSSVDTPQQLQEMLPGMLVHIVA